LQSEVEKAINEMRNKKATDDDVPGDVFKLPGEGGLKIMIKLINTIYIKLKSDPRTSRKIRLP
jgi:hypothetical protein